MVVTKITCTGNYRKPNFFNVVNAIADYFLDKSLNIVLLLSFIGKYLEGFLLKFEYMLKKYFTILSSREWKLTTTSTPLFPSICVALINPKISSVSS